MYFKLNYADGSFSIVAPPSASQGRLVEVYNTEFRKAIAEENVWIFDKEISTSEDLKKLELLELKLFTKYICHYDKLASFFDLKINDLAYIDRYYFFVCTKPVEILEGRWQRGLSYLESLLGYSYSTEGNDDSHSPITTGSQYLDIIATTVLNFKVIGLEDKFSIFDLVKMNKYVNDSVEEIDKKVNKGKSRNNYKFTSDKIKEEKLDKAFIDSQEAIFLELSDLGIMPPS